MILDMKSISYLSFLKKFFLSNRSFCIVMFFLTVPLAGYGQGLRVQKMSSLELLQTNEVADGDFSLMRLLNGEVPEIGLLKVSEAKIYFPDSKRYFELNKVQKQGLTRRIVGGSVADLVKKDGKFIVLGTMPSGVSVLDNNGERLKSFDIRPGGRVIPIFPQSNYNKMHLSQSKLIIGKSIVPVYQGGSRSWDPNEALIYSVDIESEEVDVVMRRSNLKISSEQHSELSLRFSVSGDRVYIMTDDLNEVYIHDINGEYLGAIDISFLNFKSDSKLKDVFVYEGVLSLIVRDEDLLKTDLIRVELGARNFSRLGLHSGTNASYDVVNNLIAYSYEIDGLTTIKVSRIIDDW